MRDDLSGECAVEVGELVRATDGKVAEDLHVVWWQFYFTL